MKQTRRHFIKGALSATALGALTPFTCIPFEPIPMEFDLMEERAKQQQAIYTLTFASPYQTALYKTTPHLHQQLKYHIESLSKGKIYVAIYDSGQLGIGTDLMAAISHNRIDAALISVSNLSRALPLLDILNIPFWASSNQAYLNLISSNSWKELVLEPIKSQGKLDVLLHHIVGARTLTTVKRLHKSIIAPNDLRHMTFRVPASSVLHQFYRLTAANIVEVPWGKVARMARLGLIDALDPSIVGLNAGPDNLKKYLGHITKIESVPDAWVTVISQQWLKRLPNTLKEAVTHAASLTFLDHLEQINSVQALCETQFKRQGTKIYQPTQSEQAQWVELYGHHVPAWHKVKTTLLGELKTFDKLLAATKETSPFKLS